MFNPTNRETKQTVQEFFPEGDTTMVAVSANKQLIAFYMDMEDPTQNTVHPLDPTEWYVESKGDVQLEIDHLYYVSDVSVHAIRDGHIEHVHEHEISMGVR